MSAENGFEVQAAALTTHADTVDDVATQVAQGRSAGASVRLGRNAYGVLCQIIPALLDPIQEQTIAAMRTAADSLQSVADDLRVVARAYPSSDHETAQSFRDLSR